MLRAASARAPRRPSDGGGGRPLASEGVPAPPSPPPRASLRCPHAAPPQPGRVSDSTAPGVGRYTPSHGARGARSPAGEPPVVPPLASARLSTLPDATPRRRWTAAGRPPPATCWPTPGPCSPRGRAGRHHRQGLRPRWLRALLAEERRLHPPGRFPPRSPHSAPVWSSARAATARLGELVRVIGHGEASDGRLAAATHRAGVLPRGPGRGSPRAVRLRRPLPGAQGDLARATREAPGSREWPPRSPSDLAVGACCPVCGSAEHPQKAVPEAGAPSAASEKAARSALDDAEPTRAAHDARVRDLLTSLSVAETRAGRQPGNPRLAPRLPDRPPRRAGDVRPVAEEPRPPRRDSWPGPEVALGDAVADRTARPGRARRRLRARLAGGPGPTRSGSGPTWSTPCSTGTGHGHPRGPRLGPWRRSWTHSTAARTPVPSAHDTAARAADRGRAQAQSAAVEASSRLSRRPSPGCPRCHWMPWISGSTSTG